MTDSPATRKTMDEIQIRLSEIAHQLRSFGETLQTLDYNLADGVHLPGFGISLCKLSEELDQIRLMMAAPERPPS